jgi:hypothetical protein
LVEFPLGMFGVAIGTVILPHLSRRHADSDATGYSQALDWGLRLTALVARCQMPTRFFHFDCGKDAECHADVFRPDRYRHDTDKIAGFPHRIQGRGIVAKPETDHATILVQQRTGIVAPQGTPQRGSPKPQRVLRGCFIHDRTAFRPTT